MSLSNKAIQDLRKEFINIYGEDFGLNDEELEEIGMFLLTSLAEGMKLRFNNSKTKQHS